MRAAAYWATFRHSDLYGVCLKRSQEFINGLLRVGADFYQLATKLTSLSVSVQPEPIAVPEPTPLALMMVGFTAIGLLVFRSRQNAPCFHSRLNQVVGFCQLSGQVVQVLD